MTPDEMKARIQTAYPDGEVQVVDTTGTLDHFRVTVTSAQFKDLSRIRQHQALMSLFAPELKSGEVHALEIKTTAK